MNAVEFHHLAKSYGATPVLQDINLTVEDGDFMVIYGLPTSGKSVLVRLLTGLEKPDSGQIILRGDDVTMAEPGARNIGYVPQSFALYPHLSVRKNISYPLDLIRAAKSDINSAVERVSELLGIAELLDRKPDQLSGGQKQRVAIARGLAKETDIFLLDDPLIGLDFKLRERLIDDLKQTQKVLGVTFIYTTSDAIETLMLAKNIAVMDQGEIGQRPEIKTELFSVQLDFLSEETNGQALPEPSQLDNQPIKVGVRPEHIVLGDDPPPGALTHKATVLLREDLGGEEIVYLEAGETNLTAVLTGESVNEMLLAQLDLDQTVMVSIDPSDLVIYTDSQRIGKGGDHA